MNKSPDKHYADEFFKRTTKPISKAEYARINQPHETQQELLRLLDAWRNNAQAIIEKNTDQKAVKDAREIIAQADKVYRLLFGKDKCALALEAIALGSQATTASLPEFVNELGSRGGKRAVNERHSRIWTPVKLAALKKEIENCMDKFEHPTTMYKHLAELILKDKKKWRQIETAAKKITSKK